MRADTETIDITPPTVCRRRFVRYKFYIGARVEYESRIVHGKVSNISREGMFIKITDPPPLDTRFSAYLALDTPLRLDCVVRHVIPHLGVGVFVSVPEIEQRRFDALLLALSATENGAQVAALRS